MVTSTLIISTAFAFGVGTGMFMSRRRRENENGGTNIPHIPHDPYHPSIIPPFVAEKKTSGCIKTCRQDGSSMPSVDCYADIRDRRIDTAIRLIQNDQAITAMRVLMGEDDDLLETNPLKDYPQDQLNERGYRKFYDSACRIAELEEENARLQAELEALRGEK